jgi:hypothetical protein
MASSPTMKHLIAYVVCVVEGRQGSDALLVHRAVSVHYLSAYNQTSQKFWCNAKLSMNARTG